MKRSTILRVINNEIKPKIALSEEAIDIFRRGGRVANLSDFSNSCEVMEQAVKRDGSLLSVASENIKNNDNIVIQAINNCGEAIIYANERFRSNADIVLDAFVSSEGRLSLNDVDPRFKKDFAIAFVAVISNPQELSNVDESLKNNAEFIDLIRSELNPKSKESDSYQKVIGI